jgi:hypothetical protein
LSWAFSSRIAGNGNYFPIRAGTSPNALKKVEIFLGRVKKGDRRPEEGRPQEDREGTLRVLPYKTGDSKHCGLIDSKGGKEKGRQPIHVLLAFLFPFSRFTPNPYRSFAMVRA